MRGVPVVPADSPGDEGGSALGRVPAAGADGVREGDGAGQPHHDALAADTAGGFLRVTSAGRERGRCRVSAVLTWGWFGVCVLATGALIVGAMWLAHGDGK